MEIELKFIHTDADVYDVRKAVALVLHGPDFYDPNDKENKGRRPNFEIVMGESPAGRTHNGTAILRVAEKLGKRLLRWNYDSEENNIVVNGRHLRLFNAHRSVPFPVQQTLEKALYIDPDRDRLRSHMEYQARQVRLRIARLQFGVWYKPSNSPGKGRSFSVEYERDFLRQSSAYISVVYEHKLVHIDRETEENNYLILVKFSNIRKLGLGYDEFNQAYIVFDLFTPPIFEQESYNNRVPAGINRKQQHKTRDRISAIDDDHTNVAHYAHHIRVLLARPDDLLEFEKICYRVKCEPRPIRIRNVDAQKMKFFSYRKLYQVQLWIKTMEWKNAFQIEAYLRCGLLNTHDLLVTLQKPIEDAIHYYGEAASEFLRLFFIALKDRDVDEEPSACLARMREKHTSIKQKQLTTGLVACHHVVITPSRMLLEGPYPTQSNRVIRRYPNHAEHFIRVEFRDEDHLGYRWDGDVDGTWFLQQRVGGNLRHGFELAGRAFEFLAYSSSQLRDHSVWFVSPFRDPVEGYVTAEKIRASLGDFSKLLRTPSKYAARIAQAFTATDPSVKIRRDQWEEQQDIGPKGKEHTDGVGTISPQLADMIWEAKRKASRKISDNRVKPSAYQIRFLGYKGVVVVDRMLKDIRMRLRPSQQKFPVYDVEEAEIEIARSFDYPNPVHLNRPAVMALEDRGVKQDTFINLQEEAKKDIYCSSDSLNEFSKLLRKDGLGGKFYLAPILDQLHKLGLDFKDRNKKRAIKSAFFERLLRFSQNHSLREVKFKARIPVPQSYQLVGVADEGRAYINGGAKESDVFTLGPGEIYVCVQKYSDEDPIYFKGSCVISRSPVIHPGDVQRVYAVGKPPKDKICFFDDLKNVVVLPAVGDRSLASCLAGGDLDGDTYDVYYENQGLLPTVHTDPAEYPATPLRTLDRDATVEDICDFVVEYINSDVMGLLANRHIIIADQSTDGVFDSRCIALAAMCSQAVDYAKNGTPVDLQNNLPRPLIKYKPDWEKKEVTGGREVDYYESDRALGLLYRKIKLNDPKEPVEGILTESPGETAPLEDVISRVLRRYVRRTLNMDGIELPGAENGDAEQIHEHYMLEMRYICVTHTLVDASDIRLKEEEIVLGTILAHSTQPRWRSDRSYRMKLHAEELVSDIRTQVIKIKSEGELSDEQLRAGLLHAWKAWGWAQHHRDKEFIESFSLIMLGIILDCLKRLRGLPEGELPADETLDDEEN
ncbi:RdRP-domain-containing protein [Russula earlei]|uniref:RdRP-domain-containing protein n=1 Tax=Russula earlei TaxID=71964 RepID=A0ACC0TXU9_9AGAM|nr:RdRP-domain-containing protein [Russula earlei]